MWRILSHICLTPNLHINRAHLHRCRASQSEKHEKQLRELLEREKIVSLNRVEIGKILSE